MLSTALFTVMLGLIYSSTIILSVAFIIAKLSHVKLCATYFIVTMSVVIPNAVILNVVAPVHLLLK